jgi:hypothetical protein
LLPHPPRFLGSLARAEEAGENVPVPVNAWPPGRSFQLFPVVSFKKELQDLGYRIRLNYKGDVRGNPTGGVKQGVPVGRTPI